MTSMINFADEDAELISAEGWRDDNEYYEQNDEPGRNF